MRINDTYETIISDDLFIPLMKDLLIQNGISEHILLMSLALTIIVIGQTLASRKIQMLSVLVLLIDAFIFDNSSGTNKLPHLFIDLIMISGLSLIPMFYKKNLSKLFLIPLLIFFNFLIHGKVSKIVDQPESLDPTAELLVEFKDSKALQAWILAHDDEYVIRHPIFNPADLSGKLDEYLAIDVANKMDIERTIKSLKSYTEIVHIEKNQILSLDTPAATTIQGQVYDTKFNDPLSGQQWHINNSEISDYYQKLESLNNKQGKEKTIIAILDTGIEAKHEDLQDNYASTQSQYDNDPRGHGTHCAGIAAAVTGNNIGISSIVPPQLNIKVTGIKVLSSLGLGSQVDIINGIIEAVDKGADVISLSLGGISTAEKEKAYIEAVEYASKRNCIVIVAAGNSSSNAANYSPANTRGVIAVGSINKEKRKSSFSNHLEYIEMGIYAPGENIYSTFIKNQYKAQSGTSMAAPFVAGFAGVCKSLKPDLSTQEFYSILEHASDNTNGLLIINPYRAIEQLLQEL